MSDLGAELRHAIKNGLLHMSLHCNWKGIWMAAYRNTDNNLVQYVEDADPEKALLKAIRAGVRDTKRKEPLTKPPTKAEMAEAAELRKKNDVIWEGGENPAKRKARLRRERDAEDML